MDEASRRKLITRLEEIHKRVQWMADAEERSAWVNGWAARGGLMEEKLNLLDETDQILDRLEGK